MGASSLRPFAIDMASKMAEAHSACSTSLSARRTSLPVPDCSCRQCSLPSASESLADNTRMALPRRSKMPFSFPERPPYCKGSSSLAIATNSMSTAFIFLKTSVRHAR